MKRQNDGKGSRQNAYLTVFLALSLPIVLSLFLTVIEGARMNALRTQIECTMHIAMNSVLSEYSRELQERYDLFFVDTSYGTSEASEGKISGRLQYYLDGNFECDTHSFTAPYLRSVSIDSTRYAADNDCKALREQVYAYMAADPAGSVAAGVLAKVDLFNGLGPDLSSYERAWAQNREELLNAKAEAAEEAEKEGLTLEDPSDPISEFRIQPALWQAGISSKVSDAGVNTDSLLSHRRIYTGDGLEDENAHGYPRADALVFDQYLTEKCSFYGEEQEDSRLKYELEYILFGQDSDRENLEMMTAALLLVRNAANCMYIFTDTAKAAEADGLAAVIAIVLLNPEIQPILKNAILFAWAYLESVQDVRALMNGKRVPLRKDASSWKTSIYGILTPDSASGEEGGGWSYKDYLRVYLYLENGSTKNYRFMDIVEVNMRTTEGNEHFRMDRCLDTFSASASIGSEFGYSYYISRTAGYN